MKTPFIACIVMLLSAIGANSQTFTETPLNTIPRPVQPANFEWIDIDKDNDLDAFVFSEGLVQIYRNDDGTLSTIGNFLTGGASLQYQTYVFGDYDLDQDVDFLISQNNAFFVATNNGNMTFTLKPTGLRGGVGHVSWVDVDGDGDLDINYGFNIFLNSNGIYEQLPITLPNTISGYSWVDLDNDNLLDVIVVQEEGFSQLKVVVYRNSGRGVFHDPVVLTTNFAGNFTWLDVDGDQDLDLATGERTSATTCTIFKNLISESGTFSFERSVSIGNFPSPWVVAADLDLDGLPDLVVHEHVTQLSSAFVYRNLSAGETINFEKTATLVTAQRIHDIDIVDFNGDQKPDVFFSGLRDFSHVTGRLATFFLNTTAVSVPILSSPASLQTTVEENAALSWTHDAADKTVYYNLQILKNGELYRPSFAEADGSLVKPDLIPLIPAKKVILHDLSAGNYQWRVQTFNHAFNSSEFSEYASFSIGQGPTNLTTVSEGPVTAKLTWTYSTSGHSGFVIYRRVGSGAFSQLTTLGPLETSFIDADLTPNQGYSYYIRAVSNGAYSEASNTAEFYSGVLVQTLLTGQLQYLTDGNGINADFDQDGDYDFAVIGSLGGAPKSAIMINDGTGSFSTTTSFLPEGILYTLIAGSDFDQDGDMDVCVVGEDNDYKRVMVFRNDNSVFTKIFETEQYVSVNQLAFEDINHDNHPDLLFAYSTFSSSGYRLLYGAAGETFSVSDTEFTPAAGKFYLAELNDDGFTDIVFTGTSAGAHVWKNLNGRGFVRVTSNLPQLNAPFFFDFNADGYVDVLHRSVPLTIYEGNGDFTFSSPQTTDIEIGESISVKLADLDLNGWADWLITDGYQMRIYYAGPNGSLEESSFKFVNTWGTYMYLTNLENDGDIDFIRFGKDLNWNSGINYVYRNQTASSSLTNNAPSVPQFLRGATTTEGVTFQWGLSEDDRTPQKLLSYNISIYDIEGNAIVHPQTNPAGTFRRIVAPGNVGQRHFFHINDLKPGEYTIKVQAMDASFQASAWSDPLNFSILEGPENLTITRIKLNSIKLDWADGPEVEERVLVFRKTSTTEFTLLAVLPAGTTSYYDPQLEYENVYTYKIIEVVDETFTASSNVALWNTAVLMPGDPILPDFSGVMNVGDFTGDGKMDMVVLTSTAGLLLENPGTQSVWMAQTVTPTALSLTFEDINHDSKLDLYRFSALGSEVFKAETLINNGNKTFSNVNTIFSSNAYELIGWWDYDLDNDLDAYVARADGTGTQANLVIKNNGSSGYELGFVECPSCNEAYLFFGDFDNDGVEDVAKPNQSGYSIYRSGEGGLIAGPVIEQNFHISTAYPIDYDGDGWLDIFFTTNDWFQGKTTLYRNLGLDAGGKLQFELVKDDFTVATDFHVNWIDYDTDGDLDLFLTGYGNQIELYQNNHGQLTLKKLPALAPGHRNVQWIDLDNDGDMDFVASGEYANSQVLFNQLVTAEEGNANENPSAPIGLTAQQDSIGMHLTWTLTEDDHTSVSALTADVLIYQNDKVITKGLINPVSGQRLTLQRGRNVDRMLLKSLTPGEYTWRVQSVDQSYAGSALSEEGSFMMRPPVPDIDEVLVLYICDGKGLSVEGENVEWFSDRALSNKIGSGTLYLQESKIVFVTQTVNGIQSLASYANITVLERPLKPISITPNPMFYCEPQSGSQITLTVEGTDLTWATDSTMLEVMGFWPSENVQATDSIYYVTQNIQNCISEPLRIRVEGVIIDTDITREGTQLVVAESAADEYKWYVDGVLVPDSNQPFVEKNQIGAYRVGITKNQCYELSDAYVITGIDDDAFDLVGIYPNPVKDHVTINIPDIESDCKLQIFDSSGRQVFDFQIYRGQSQLRLDASAWRAGIYLVRISGKQSAYLSKIVRTD